jgi:hypothetical protein
LAFIQVFQVNISSASIFFCFKIAQEKQFFFKLFVNKSLTLLANSNSFSRKTILKDDFLNISKKLEFFTFFLQFLSTKKNTLHKTPPPLFHAFPQKFQFQKYFILFASNPTINKMNNFEMIFFSIKCSLNFPS